MSNHKVAGSRLHSDNDVYNFQRRRTSIGDYILDVDLTDAGVGILCFPYYMYYALRKL